MQKRIHSLIESLTNIAIGYGIAVTAQVMILPLFGLNTSVSNNCKIAGCFTVISIIRTYTIRRWFNKITFTGQEVRMTLSTILRSVISIMQRLRKWTVTNLTARGKQFGIKFSRPRKPTVR